MSNEKKVVEVAVAANIPVILKGDPGIGKTAFIQSLAEAQKSVLHTIIASTHAPEDFLGLPIKTASEDVVYAPPQWAKRLNKVVEDGGKALLFLDEFSCAAPAVQAAGLRLIHERVVGEYEMNKAVRIIGAMNPPETAAGGWNLEPPAANRMAHVPWSVSATEWADGLMEGWGVERFGRELPTDWKSQCSHNNARISTYIRVVGSEHLLNVPKDESKAGGPWPSPRTWDFTAQMLTAAEIMYPGDGELQFHIMKALVGEAEAITYQQWVQNMDLPNPVDLLEGNVKFELPDRADKVAAVLSSVVSTTIAELKPEWWTQAWTIMDIVAQSKHPDIAASMARSLAQAGKNDRSLPDISQYTRSFAGILAEAGIYQSRKAV